MKRAICILLACVLLCFSGCAKQADETVFAMDTVMELQLWGPGSPKALKQLKALIADMEETWSAQKETSKLSALNRGKGADAQMKELLTQVQDLSNRTMGAFDPQMYELTQLWGFHTGQHHVPEKNELFVALHGQKWDLGGAVKGWTGQKAVALLEKTKVSHAILNLGGNVQTYGEKPDGTPWTIGIQNPNGGDYIGLLSVTGTTAVVTSGDYQRYFEQNGVRYHHILDPVTGYPAQSGLSSVTVICKNGLTADVLSTALFVMGLEQGSAFWRQSNDFEAVFITTDGLIYVTEGAELSGCEYRVISR